MANERHRTSEQFQIQTELPKFLECCGQYILIQRKILNFNNHQKLFCGNRYNEERLSREC